MFAFIIRIYLFAGLVSLCASLLASPVYAGPWGQTAAGAWYVQGEISWGALGDQPRDSYDLYAETGLTDTWTVALSHFTSSGVLWRDNFGSGQTDYRKNRLSIQKRLWSTPRAAFSLGSGIRQVEGFQAGISEDETLNCDHETFDLYTGIGFSRPISAPRENLDSLSKRRPRSRVYIIDGRFDINGPLPCREIQLDFAIIDKGKTFNREIHIWHNEAQGERLGGQTSTKYRALYRLDREPSTFYIALTHERSGQFEQTSTSLGFSHSFRETRLW